MTKKLDDEDWSDFGVWKWHFERMVVREVGESPLSNLIVFPFFLTAMYFFLEVILPLSLSVYLYCVVFSVFLIPVYIHQARKK